MGENYQIGIGLQLVDVKQLRAVPAKYGIFSVKHGLCPKVQPSGTCKSLVSCNSGALEVNNPPCGNTAAMTWCPQRGLSQVRIACRRSD